MKQEIEFKFLFRLLELLRSPAAQMILAQSVAVTTADESQINLECPNAAITDQ